MPVGFPLLFRDIDMSSIAISILEFVSWIKRKRLGSDEKDSTRSRNLRENRCFLFCWMLGDLHESD